MRQYKVLILFSLLSQLSFSQTTVIDTVYSKNTKDNYIITIRKPADFNKTKKYHHVYITDGSIGIGDYILGKSSSWQATIPASCIIILISHTGDWHKKRPRDFIPSDIRKNSSDDFGKADKFYLFLKKELFALVEHKLPNKKDRAFIGHSFGGLFCLYTLFREDVLFDHHFAISPSIWANYYELDDIEKTYFKTHKKLKANVHLYVGGLEFLNKVLYSTRSFYSTILERKYASLLIQIKEFADANHFSIRKPAIDQAFEALK